MADDREGPDLDTPSAGYDKHAPDWALITALRGGTRAMREAAEEYLPRAESEEIGAYQVRLNSSFLFDGFGAVLDALSAMPFPRPVTLREDVPPRIADIAENVDLRGNNLTVFAHGIFRTLLAYGSAHFLVDFPSVAPAASLADERARRARPYWVPVHPTDLLGWQHEYIDGMPVLVQARIRERVVEHEDYGEREIEQIRVLWPGQYEIWRKDKKGSWGIHDEGEVSMPIIPLVSIVAHDGDLMTAKAPLMPLAWLNVEHWQSASDQRHILHYARCPMMVAAGLQDADEVRIGPNVLVNLPDAQASLRWVEHGGASISAGAADLQRLEERMSAWGVELLRPQSNVTATQTAINAEASMSRLQMLAHRLQDGIENGLGFTAMWLGGEFSDGGQVEVFKDFNGAATREADITNLIAIRANGDISRLTLLKELKRRTLFADDFDPDAEAAAVEDEGLASMGDSGGLPPVDDPAAPEPEVPADEQPAAAA